MMPSSRIPSPAHSQGTISTPRRNRPRTSRSVGSPARSNSSVKLTEVLQLNTFALSPIPNQRSVLTDTTDIDVPGRKSWWKNLNENSRELMEVLHTREPSGEANTPIEEYIEVDILSQEKKTYILDLPESSDAESINSIVIPQKKLFKRKESNPQTKFVQIIDNRESLATLHRTQGDDDNVQNIGRKTLFNHGSRQRTKPLFPSALLNISANKTVNKTKELVATDTIAPVKSLFGNRPGTKRKNIFIDFIVSDSEDEIPEIQPKVFGFQKQIEKKRSSTSRGDQGSFTLTSSNVTDIEIDDWRLLPSSTMVDHQIEDSLKTTPRKKARLTKSLEAKEAFNTESNTTLSKTKQFNKLQHSKSNFKTLSKFRQLEVNELIAPPIETHEITAVSDNHTNNKNKFVMEMDTATKNLSHEQTLNDKGQRILKNINPNKTVNELASNTVNELKEKKNDTNRDGNCSKSSKTISKIDQVLQSDEDENFTLVYENDEVCKNEIENQAQDPKENLQLKHITPKTITASQQLCNKSQSQSNIHNSSQIDNKSTVNQNKENQHKKHRKSLQSSYQNTHQNQQDNSKIENNEVNIDKIVGNTQNTSKFSKNDNYDDNENDRNVEQQGHDNTVVNNKNTSDTRGNITRDNEEQAIEYEEIVCEKEFDDENQLSESIDPNVCNDEVDEDEQEEDNNQDTNNSEQNSESIDPNVCNDEVDEDEQEEDNIQDTNNSEQNLTQEAKDNSEEVEENIKEIILARNEKYKKITNLDDENADTIQGKMRCINEEIRQSKSYQENEKDDKYNYTQRDEKNTQYELNKKKLESNESAREHRQDEVDSEIINGENNDRQTQSNKEDSGNKTAKRGANITHDTNKKQKQDVTVLSPEAILHNKLSQIDSFTNFEGRNNSERKTKSIIKNLTIRASLAPVRESTGFSDGSRNSSAERSGWDSHRTTRATLRQTFGKDFTPRKSLRTLVMEKSAKRQTNFTVTNVEISRFPQANSTELAESQRFAIDECDIVQKMNERDQSDALQRMDKSINSNDIQRINKLNQKISGDINMPNIAKKILETCHNMPNDTDNVNDAQKMSESIPKDLLNIDECDKPHILKESNHEVTRNNNKSVDAPEMGESDHEICSDINETDNATDTDDAGQEVCRNMNDSDNVPEMDDLEQDISHNDKSAYANKDSEFDLEQENTESDNIHDIGDLEEEVSRNDKSAYTNNCNESELEQENNESDDALEMDDSQQNVFHDDEFAYANKDSESNLEQENNESDEASETDESEQEVSRNINESASAQKADESDQEDENNKSDKNEMDESVLGVMSDADDADSDQEISECEDAKGTDTTANNISQDIDMDENEEGDSDVAEDLNEPDYVQTINKRNQTRISCEEEVQGLELNHNQSLKTHQTTLEMYLQKIKKQNIERKKLLEDKIRNSLKAPNRDVLNPFKVPAVPKLRRIKTQQTIHKAKSHKSSALPLAILPDEVLEDMKYKPPKRYRPTNASWITKRLYKFLESKLESKYDYKARVRSEKLVETIYNFTKDIRRHVTAPMETVDALKHEMARLDIVKTHFEFYEFFHEYMPREVRVKVVPDVFNKISLPKYGVFSNILR